jgi:hypothetical protein
VTEATEVAEAALADGDGADGGSAARAGGADVAVGAERARAGSTWRGLVPLHLALAVVAYVPLLLTRPGWISADTKTYLYLEPTRLLRRSWTMWDPSIAAGTVTHQSIGFLWPMGPYYWLAEAVGLPDWVAQRIWWGTLIFLAGAGVAYLLRTLGWPATGPGVTAAVFVYAMTPYTLTLVARLSGILLPFTGLPWLLALVVLALRHRGWRHPALFALAVTTFGSVNATALLVVLVAPALWLLYAVWGSREVPLRRALVTTAQISVLTLPVSAWWFAGLTVEASNGVNIVRFTETARVVAATSTSPEVLRGLGYWFFYGGDRLGPWIEPSAEYTQRPLLIAVGFLVPVLGLAGAAVARWRDRTFFVLLLVAAMALAIGAFPRDHNPPFGRLVQLFQTSDLGLALRSLPRIVPVVVLALAVLLGAGVTGLARRWPRSGRPMALGIAAVAVLALPPLWLRQFVPANLQRPEEVPRHWQDVARYLDRHDDGTRVLVVPGSDFASYRWGNTVDPIVTGMMERPSLQRELAPYGSPPSVNLLDALDLRLQERTADPAALAPIARLLRAGDVLVNSDWQYERHNTPRPRNFWSFVTDAPGLGEPTGFGPGRPNRTVPDVQLEDELLLTTDPAIPDPPEVAVFPVGDAVPIVTAQAADHPLLVAGDGDGLVDAAGAGLLDGTELIRYSASLDADDVASALDGGAALLVTDSHRKRGERWTTLRHNRGYTETATGGPLATDLTDNRMEVFPDAGLDTMTVASREATPAPGVDALVEAEATSYGNSITFGPEERPILALDGDTSTAWRTAALLDARGERLELRLSAPVTADRVRLLQPTEGVRTRFITRVRLHFDGGGGDSAGDSVDVDLTGQSRSVPGQTVEFPRRRFSTLTIEILADSAGEVPRYAGESSVGFAEVDLGDAVRPAAEAIRLPTDLLDAAGDASLDNPLAVSLTRQRQDPTEPTRDDEERALARLFELPTERSFSLAGQARLSARADPPVADALWDRPHDGSVPWVRASGDLSGTVTTPAAAFDGDPATAWTTARARPRHQWVEVALPHAVTIDRLPLTVVADGLHSVPTAVELWVDGSPVDRFAVPEVDDGDRQNDTARVTLDIPEVTGSRFRLKLTDVRERRTNDWVSDNRIAQPAAIAEIGLPGPTVPALPATFDSGCRDDLLEVDGAAVPLRITGPTDDALAGRPLAVTTCRPNPAVGGPDGGGPDGSSPPALDLPAGDHHLAARPGLTTGIDLDQLVLRSAPGGTPSTGDTTLVTEAATTPAGPVSAPGEMGGPLGDVPRVEVAEDHGHALQLRVSGARPGEPFWLTLGQSYNLGWQATVDGEVQAAPELVDGFANGWLVEPRHESFDVSLEFTPQRRVNLALWTSALSALLCLVLVVRRPRPHHAPPAAEPDVFVPTTVLGYPDRCPDAAVGWRTAVLTGVGLGTAAWLLAGPQLGVVVGIVGALAVRHDRVRPLLLAASPAAAGTAALYVLYIQIRHAPLASFDWPYEMRRAHPLGWLAVLLLAADVVVGQVRARSSGRAAGRGPGGPGARRWPGRTGGRRRPA